MHPFFKNVPALVLLAALVPGAANAPSTAGEAPAEIRIGQPRTPAPKPDPAMVRSVERFFGARQTASVDRSKEAAARRWIAAGVKVSSETLAGERGQTLIAFDFGDGAITRLGDGRFRVSVYLLFADRQGRIVQSRDEVISFTGGGQSFVCSSIKTASEMRWDSDEIAKGADRLGAGQALERADQMLQDWALGQTRLGAYSIEGVFPAGSGRIMIPCLKFTSDFGKRGYDVVDAPLIMKRGSKGYMLEPVAN
jgi:hypothetical protein